MNVKEFFSKYKKRIIYIGAGIAYSCLLFFAGYFVKRGLDLRRASAISDGIEQSIESAISSANSISNTINTAGDVIGSIGNRTDDAITTIESAKGYLESESNLRDECISIIEDGNRNIETNISNIDEHLDYSIYLIECATIKSEQNERTISRITELLEQYRGSSEE